MLSKRDFGVMLLIAIALMALATWFLGFNQGTGFWPRFFVYGAAGLMLNLGAFIYKRGTSPRSQSPLPPSITTVQPPAPSVPASPHPQLPQTGQTGQTPSSFLTQTQSAPPQTVIPPVSVLFHQALSVFLPAFKKFFSLKPYGQNLLSPAASQWLVIVPTVMLIMASVEGLAWGYISSVMIAGWLGYVAAALTFLLVFLLIWSADVTLMTTDFKNHDEAPSEAPALPLLIFGHSLTSAHLHLLQNRVLPFLFRFVMVGISLWITALFLPKMVFQRDIEKFLADQYLARTEAARATIEAKYSGRIENLTSTIDAARKMLPQEVKGTGISKHRGDGPVANAIREQIKITNEELDKVKADYKKELADLQTAAKDGDAKTLESRWSVKLADYSLTGRDEALKELEKRPGYDDTKWAIKGFLMLIFASLCVLKILQPQTVQIYYSEYLQSCWKRYQAGGFDDDLTHTEIAKIKSEAMSELDFVNFVKELSRRRQSRLSTEAKTQAELKAQKEKLKQEEDLRATDRQITEYGYQFQAINQELLPKRDRYAALEHELKVLQLDVAKMVKERLMLERSISEQKKKRIELQQELTQVDAQLNQHPTPSFQTVKKMEQFLKTQQAMEQLSENLRNKVEQYQSEIHKLELQHTALVEKELNLEQHKSRLETEKGAIFKIINRVESYLNQLEELRIGTMQQRIDGLKSAHQPPPHQGNNESSSFNGFVN